MKKGRKILTWLMLLCMLPVCQVQAEGTKEGMEVPLDSFYQGEGQEELQTEIGNENGSLQVTIDTTEKEEGYYAASFFENLKISVAEYTGIRMNVKNNGENPVSMNLILIAESGETLIVRDGVAAILKENGIYTDSIVENGCMTLPAEFEGEVYVPFSMFSFTGAAEVAEFTDIMGLGFTIVVPQEEQRNVEIEGIFLPDKTEGSLEAPAYLRLEGEESVLKPTIGDSVSQYQAKVYNLAGEVIGDIPVQYEVTQCEGVQMDETGLLTIGEEAKEESITVKAFAGDELVTEKSISLKPSWTTKQKTENGYDASLASPEEVADIAKKDEFLTRNGVIWAIRAVLAGAAAVFVVYYLCKRAKEKKRGGN